MALQDRSPPVVTFASQKPQPFLQALPNETLVEVMKHIPSFSALGHLIQAFPQYEGLIDKYQGDIFPSVVRASRKFEIGRIEIAIMNFRRRERGRLCPESYFYHWYLWDEDVEIEIDHLYATSSHTATPTNAPSMDGNLEIYEHAFLSAFEKPLSALQDIAKVSHGIEEIIRSFCAARILKPSRIGMKVRPPSSTEISRIRRALWRFQLCYELLHPHDSIFSQPRAPLYPPQPRFIHYQQHPHSREKRPSQPNWLEAYNGGFYSRRTQLSSLHEYMQKLCIWEIDEIEAVRSYLAAEVNAVQQQIHCLGEEVHLPALPITVQQLYHDLNHWRPDTDHTIDHFIVLDLHLRQYTLSPTLWPEYGAANSANTTQRGRMLARHEQWGWCMWDEERLRSCGLLLEHGDAADEATRRCRNLVATDVGEWVERRWEEGLRRQRERAEAEWRE